MNNVILIGRLTKNAAIDTSGTNARAQFTLAVNRDFKNKDGGYDADFISCVIWGKSAERLAEWTKKGSRISVIGSIRTRSYEDKDGKRVYVTEVNVEKFKPLDTRAESQTARNQEGIPNAEGGNFAGQVSEEADPFAGGDPLEVSEDDLPF